MIAYFALSKNTNRLFVLDALLAIPTQDKQYALIASRHATKTTKSNLSDTTDFSVIVEPEQWKIKLANYNKKLETVIPFTILRCPTRVEPT